MSGLTDTKKRLALSIIDYLQTSAKDGTLSADEAENVEVAISCISDAYKVDSSDEKAKKDAVGSQSLLNVFTVYEKMKGRTGTDGTASASQSKSTAQPTPAAASPPSAEAEKFKSAGNAAMQQKDYTTAIEKYTQAISLSPTNPIYLSNRAAAYSASGDHNKAVEDAEIAVASDPKYTKAWSRLGLARFALGDAKGSVDAYEKGIEYEGNGGSDAMKKGLETARKELERMEKEEEDMDADPVDDAPGSTRAGVGGAGGAGGMPDLSALAGMFGGGGGGGGGGGMPDLSAIMNNPMLRGMAQNIMQNPEALGSIMNNPTVRNMMNQRNQGGGGGMPDMSQISQMMQDPAIANLAQQFMGGAGGGAGAGAGAGAGRGRGA